jgi:hypothetical protein
MDGAEATDGGPDTCGTTEFQDVQLDGGGDLVVVDPGEEVRVSLDAVLTQREGCPDCSAQLLFGLHAAGYWHEPVHCHDAGVLPPCPATEALSVWFTLTAPMTPGDYLILGSRASDASCPDAMDDYLSRVLARSELVGTLRVREPDCNPWQVYLTDVSLDGGGPEATVAPGAEVSITAGYFASQMRGCPDCLDQIIVGVGGDAQVCHDMRIIDGCPSGERGTLSGTLTAPDVSGAHLVLYGMYAHYDCDGAMQWYEDEAPGRDRAAGVIRVR